MTIQEAKQILAENGRSTCSCKYGGDESKMIEEAIKIKESQEKGYIIEYEIHTVLRTSSHISITRETKILNSPSTDFIPIRYSITFGPRYVYGCHNSTHINSISTQT